MEIDFYLIKVFFSDCVMPHFERRIIHLSHIWEHTERMSAHCLKIFMFESYMVIGGEDFRSIVLEMNSLTHIVCFSEVLASHYLLPKTQLMEITRYM